MPPARGLERRACGKGVTPFTFGLDYRPPDWAFDLPQESGDLLASRAVHPAPAPELHQQAPSALLPLAASGLGAVPPYVADTQAPPRATIRSLAPDSARHSPRNPAGAQRGSRIW